jgi:MFS family permease
MIAIIFSVACMIFNDNYALVTACKTIVGISAGMFNVYCPKFLMESAPQEISGMAGGSFQLLCCLGIWTNAIMGLVFGNDALKEDGKHDDLARTAFIIFNVPPIIFSVLQIVCMLTCFR